MTGSAFMRGAAVGGVGAMAVLCVSSALAGTGVGGVFNLGVPNSVNKTTTLTGKGAGAQLAVTNTSKTTGSHALSLTGGAKTTPTLQVTNPNNGAGAVFNTTGAAPPFTVNSTGKVAKLNADLLDGLDSSAFLGAGAKAADSDKLDGLDSSQFVQGTGATASHAEAIAPGLSGDFLSPADGIDVAYFCPSVLTNTGTVGLENDTADVINVFVDSGQANPTYVQLAVSATITVPTAAAGDSVTFQVQGALGAGYGIGSIFVDVVNRSADCHFQVQTLFTAGS